VVNVQMAENLKLKINPGHIKQHIVDLNITFIWYIKIVDFIHNIQ